MSDEKVIKLITKINRETSMEQIKWIMTNPPKSLTTATDDQVFVYFETEYKDKKIAIYERKYKYFIDEDVYHWSEEIVFAVMNNEHKVILSFTRQVSALNDLMSKVRNQVANIDNLLDDLLN